MLSFRKTPVAIKLFDERVRGVRRKIYLEKFLYHSDENTLGELFVLCLRNIPEAKRFMEKRGGGINFFRRKNFVPKCQIISSEKPSVLYFRKTPVAARFFDKRVRGREARFSVEKFFVSQYRK